MVPVSRLNVSDSCIDNVSYVRFTAESRTEVNDIPQVVKPRPKVKAVISERLFGAWMSASAAGVEATPQEFCDKFAEIIQTGLVREGFLLIRPDDEGAVERVAKTHYEYGQGGKWDRPADAPLAPFPAYADEHDKSLYRDYARRLLASLGNDQ